MFHWICPECGREIAPTVRECPACDPAAATVESALAGEVEAPARATDIGTEGAEINGLELRLEGADSVRLPQQAGSDVPPALAARVKAVSPQPVRNWQRIADTESTDALLPQFGAPDGGGHPLDQFSAMLDSMEPEPPPSRATLPMPMRALPKVPASLRAFISELQPAGTKANAPLTPLQRVRAAFEPPLLTAPAPLPLRSHAPVASPPLGAKLLALPALPVPALQTSTRPIHLAAALAPLGHYSPLAGRPLQPALPDKQILKRACAPRTTLTGPMLTRRLVKFGDRERRAIAPGLLRAKKRLIPGWMVSALIIGTLLGAGFTSVVSLVRPSSNSKQPSVAEAAAPAALHGAAPAPSPSASPLEVTGFRIQIDPEKKSQIQYLVVNHTPQRVTGVNLNVTLYAADAKAGQPPLCSFQFAAPSLGPFQAKDMTSAIETTARTVTVPDWQALRASVEILP